MVCNEQFMASNERANLVVGKRPEAIQLFIPGELGYFCPLCFKEGRIKNLEDIEMDESLEFSEYNGFLYCEECNLDIPTFFCLHINNGKKLSLYKFRFIDFCEKLICNKFTKNPNEKTYPFVIKYFSNLKKGKYQKPENLECPLCTSILKSTSLWGISRCEKCKYVIPDCFVYKFENRAELEKKIEMFLDFCEDIKCKHEETIEINNDGSWQLNKCIACDSDIWICLEKKRDE